MHTSRRRLVLVSTLAIGLCGLASQAVAEETSEPESLLFVGNSLTSGNGGVGAHVAALAASGAEPRTLRVEESTSGSANLLTHRYAGVGDEIESGDFDVVVLQGDIPANLGRAELFVVNARLLHESIEGAGARTVFFMAWPYENAGSVALDDIVAPHRQVEVELDATVAPVGLAMERAHAERPDLRLVVDRRGHASPAGTYLAAATIYAVLFDRSPEGLPYRMEGVGDEDAALLQRIAWEVVQEWREGFSP